MTRPSSRRSEVLVQALDDRGLTPGLPRRSNASGVSSSSIPRASVKGTVIAERSLAVNPLREEPSTNLQADLGLLQLVEILAQQAGPAQLF